MKKLLDILQSKDYEQFKEFMRVQVGSVTESEETEFCRLAPEEWIRDYISVIYPCPQAERCLMVRASFETLKLSHDNWNFFSENVLWAFESASFVVCKKVLDCLDHKPGDGIEQIMVRRGSSTLFKCWLKKFNSLDEDTERLLEESNSLQPLKMIYIEQQLASTV